ncbi:MAG: aldose 1-epimerase family protein [Eubacteriales bacterium]|nr:aldose 1-epimerase family protein [Eubacteriales bacterium]
MDKKEIMSYVGSMQQAMSVRPVLFKEGRAEGLQAYEVKNDRLSFTVMADKCLDIAEVNWMGYNISFLSKPGLAGRNHYDTNGQEAQRSIMGGMVFTCGLENICAPCTVSGKEYPMHGRIRTTPAEYTGADSYWTDGTPSRCEIQIKGEMREAELFGENMVLRRSIKTTWQVPEIRIKDRITNEGFREETMMLLYHFNVGYPLLSEASEIVLPTKEVVPRDGAAAGHVDGWNRMEKPKDNEPEYVFLHKLASDKEGNTFAAVINEELGIGVKIQFNQKYLPYFMQWKSIASGDYVVGLEPANSSVFGKEYHLERGDLHTLHPFETEDIELRLSFLAGKELKKVKEEAAQLLE